MEFQKKRLSQHGEGTVITIDKYVHENAIAEVLRVVHFNVKVGLSVKEWNHNWKPLSGPYGECCV